MQRDKMEIKIFVSYSHHDKAYLEENNLLGYLRGLERENVRFWWDEQLVAGDKWDDEIRRQIKEAHIALALVSQWFLDSGYCTEVEISEFLKQSRENGLVIIPIILSPCEWTDYEWLCNRQFLPANGENIEEHYIEMGKRKKLFLEIRQALKVHINQIRQKSNVSIGLPKINSQLLNHINRLKEECKSKNLPFYTPILLLSLLEIENSLTNYCFKQLRVSLADEIRLNLRNYMDSTLPRLAEGEKYTSFQWYSRADMRKAGEFAAEDSAEEILEKHLLLGILSVPSNTVTQLREILGGDFSKLIEIVKKAPDSEGLMATPGRIFG